MLEPFYATIKLTTGEEILSEVTRTEEHGVEFLILSDPIVVHETSDIDENTGSIVNASVPRKWMTYSGDELIILHMEHVITVVELDQFSADYYKTARLTAKMHSPVKRKVRTERHSGYLGSYEECRSYLETIYKMSSSERSEDL